MNIQGLIIGTAVLWILTYGIALPLAKLISGTGVSDSRDAIQSGEEKLVEQIRQKMEEKSTRELLEIWKENDREKWSNEAFEAIHEVLLVRGESLPAQKAIDSKFAIQSMDEKWVEQIRRKMGEKSTGELLEIWKENDRKEWSNEA
ncbi:MAG: hypothetical protein NT106_09845, partial [Candidatus Sumerlaeota bacterium]|nr:hypothetical protein [Candidatus Sumerlaeota bacterium]